MSAVVSVKIKNFDEIRTAWKKAPQKMSSEINRAIARTILTVEAAAKREAPVNKQSGGGNLRQSISSHMSGMATGVVEVGAEYGLYVHEGTKPHIIQAKSKRTLANKRTGQFFGRTVNHPGTRANPFLQRAADSSSAAIEDHFIQAIENVFK